MAKHKCPNRFAGEGAKGGCYFEIEPGEAPDTVTLRVGWSCVVVHEKDIPVTWLSEVIAIATGHSGGVAGFLREHNYAGGYALAVDPEALTAGQHKERA